jgi:putative transposase
VIKLWMWTAQTRGRVAALEKKTRRFPTNLTDEEWCQIEPFLVRPGKTGRRRRIELREVFNAIRYLARTGYDWRMLPANFPTWQTVCWWFRRFVRLFLFKTIHDLDFVGPSDERRKQFLPAVANGNGDIVPKERSCT